jgi:hypothetical protein
VKFASARDRYRHCVQPTRFQASVRVTGALDRDLLAGLITPKTAGLITVISDSTAAVSDRFQGYQLES